MTKKLQSNIKKKKRVFNPSQDNENWQELFDTQFNNLQSKNAISKIWINGLSKLGINNEIMPTAIELTEISKKYTGYTFIQTQESIIVEQIDWYRSISRYEMPISCFLRTPEELSYCDEPDNWHEIIGHIPFLMDKEYSDMYQNLARLYIENYESKNDSKLKVADFLGGMIIELGLIKEQGVLRAFGVTLYSSSGELERAYEITNQKIFTPEAVEQEKGYERSDFQNTYYIIESIEQINDLINKTRNS